MSEWTITFDPVAPGWTLLLAFALSAALVLRAGRKSEAKADARLARVLTTLRLVALGLAFAALAGPTARMHRWSAERGAVAVLADASESMTISDTISGLSRAEEVGRVLFGGGLLDSLSRLMEVRQFAFGRDIREVETLESMSADESVTDLAGALGAIAEGRLAAVAIFSDGADTAGGDLESSIERLASSGVPVFAVGVGGRDFLDVELADVSATRTAMKDTLVAVRASLRSTGLAGVSVPVRLLELTPGGSAETLLAERQVTLGGEPVEVKFEFIPARSGLVEYAVETPGIEGEAITRNNRREFALTVERRKIRVLYMEGTEYRRPEARLWEHEFLEEALEADGDIELTTLLRRNVERARQAGVHVVGDPERGFPHTRAGLFEYDVIVCSDIDIDFFSDEQLANTVEFVGRHGGGYLMIGGWTAYGPGGYHGSVIDKILPVEMTGRFDGYIENEVFVPVVTDEGLRHPIMRLDPDPARNREIWQGLTPFHGHNKVQRAKPAAAVLAYHPTARNLYGPNVVIAVQPYGRGRAMAFTTDTTAGWGLTFQEKFGEDGDNQHYRRFWQNAIKWLAHYRMTAPSRRVAIEIASASVERGRPVMVRVVALDDDYEPLVGADATLTITGPSGEAREIMVRTGSATELRFEGLGQHLIEAVAPHGKDAVGISVRRSATEFLSPRLAEASLRRIAERTGGRYYDIADIARLPEDLADLARSMRESVDRPLWDNWLVWAAMAGLLSAEWLLRKRAGLP